MHCPPLNSFLSPILPLPPFSSINFFLLPTYVNAIHTFLPPSLPDFTTRISFLLSFQVRIPAHLDDDAVQILKRLLPNDFTFSRAYFLHNLQRKVRQRCLLRVALAEVDKRDVCG